MEEIVLGDIREMAQRIVLDEKAVREDFIRHNAELADQAIKSAKKELQAKRKRTEEVSRLMQVAYEDRVRGKMPEDICIGFIQKYSDEQKKLETEIAEIEAKLTETENTIQSADEFIRNIKKYLEAPERFKLLRSGAAGRGLRKRKALRARTPPAVTYRKANTSCGLAV